jgi:hypothetical protein
MGNAMGLGAVFGFLFGVAAMMALYALDLPKPVLSAYSVRLADSPGSCGR